MKAVLYSIWLQFKLDIRNKNILTAYYILPMAFYLVIGAIYKEITPQWETTLLPAMSVLAIAIAAFLGTPAPISDFFNSDIKKTYQVGNIKLSLILTSTFVSAVFHMMIVSVLIYLSAPIVFDVSTGNMESTYFLWILASIVVSSMLGILIGLVSKNSSTTTMISQLVFLPTMLLSGIILPTYILPEFLQNVSNIFPATYFVQILNAMTDITSDMVRPLGIISLITMTALTVAYKRRLKES